TRNSTRFTGFFLSWTQRAFWALIISLKLSRMTGSNRKVMLIMVATLAAGRKRTGRRYHSTASLNLRSGVVPVISTETKRTMRSRPAKRKPVITPVQERAARGNRDMGAPGIVKAFRAMTMKMMAAKNLISFSNAAKGSLAKSKAQIRTESGAK